ncbi:MAG: TlyA family RNA methyltransferase [Polyangiaceae bacterium]|nr:TlyA family RNA methyltransferase [Polyangiaceae bacterium]
MAAPRVRRERLDTLLVERGLVETRARAQALVLAGQVRSGDRVLDKPGTRLPAEIPLAVERGPRFVSRGGDKLDGALDDLGVDVRGVIAADLGASTGGFTDCLLQRGAARVYAVDVGQGLLAERVRVHPAVVVLDRTNARDLDPERFAEPLDLVTVDASFIGLEKLAPALARLLPPGGRLLALVKPQFEVGREAARRTRGVVRDPELREAAIASAVGALERAGFRVLGGVDSRVAGPRGNVERFVLAERHAPAQSTSTQTS